MVEPTIVHAIQSAAFSVSEEFSPTRQVRYPPPTPTRGYGTSWNLGTKTSGYLPFSGHDYRDMS